MAGRVVRLLIAVQESNFETILAWSQLIAGQLQDHRLHPAFGHLQLVTDLGQCFTTFSANERTSHAEFLRWDLAIPQVEPRNCANRRRSRVRDAAAIDGRCEYAPQRRLVDANDLNVVEPRGASHSSANVARQCASPGLFRHLGHARDLGPVSGPFHTARIGTSQPFAFLVGPFNAEGGAGFVTCHLFGLDPTVKRYLRPGWRETR